jgi:hypothetical protein
MEIDNDPIYTVTFGVSLNNALATFILYVRH